MVAQETILSRKAAVVALARAEAPEILTSDELESILAPTMTRLKLPGGLLSSLTGILQRRLYPSEITPSIAASQAAEKLFRHFNRNLIDLLYSTSVGRDHIEPSTASIIQHRLDLGGHVKSLDIGSACLGFIDGLELASLALEHGRARHALIVAGENSRPILELTLKRLLAPTTDRNLFYSQLATLTLGSGAAALILGRVEDYPDAPRLIASVSRSDARANNLCRGDLTHGMETDSTALMNAGVALAHETFNQGREHLNWHPHYFKHLVSHQVSAANTRKLCQTLGLDENLLLKTYPTYGNMGPVAVPFTLDLACEKGLIAKGDRLALMGIGSGLCCSMMEMVW